jgi:beta-ureidopropionase / N-carbamoyl-L-amino-acid hydrolase
MPNSPNVVPGAVRLTIELRDLSSDKLTRLAERIRLRAADIAKETNTAIVFGSNTHTAAANAAEDAQAHAQRCRP